MCEVTGRFKSKHHGALQGLTLPPAEKLISGAGRARDLDLQRMSQRALRGSAPF